MGGTTRTASMMEWTTWRAQEGTWTDARACTRRMEGLHVRRITRGTRQCAWRDDAYDARGKWKDEAKRKTRRMFAHAVKQAIARRGTAAEEAHVLLLDAKGAKSARAVRAACGMPLWNAFVPNVASPTVAELRRRGVFAWFGDVKDILAYWEDDWGCFEGVWLDYCGGISKRTQDVKHVFERGVVARGGVLAMACSSQDSALATQSDPIKPVEFSMRIVQEAASAHGYELIPALETSQGSGKDSTDLLEPAMGFPCLFRYRGIFFLMVGVA